jgi:hypothetical protein
MCTSTQYNYSIENMECGVLENGHWRDLCNLPSFVQDLEWVPASVPGPHGGFSTDPW